MKKQATPIEDLLAFIEKKGGSIAEIIGNADEVARSLDAENIEWFQGHRVIWIKDLEHLRRLQAVLPNNYIYRVWYKGGRIESQSGFLSYADKDLTELFEFLPFEYYCFADVKDFDEWSISFLQSRVEEVQSEDLSEEMLESIRLRLAEARTFVSEMDKNCFAYVDDQFFYIPENTHDIKMYSHPRWVVSFDGFEGVWKEIGTFDTCVVLENAYLRRESNSIKTILDDAFKVVEAVKELHPNTDSTMNEICEQIFTLQNILDNGVVIPHDYQDGYYRFLMREAESIYEAAQKWEERIEG